MVQTRETLSGWGRYPVTVSAVDEPASVDEIVLPKAGSVIARGQGRSYGDSAISSQGVVLKTGRMRRILNFEESTGILTADAGVTIGDILNAFVPRGWFPIVTPGTKHVSLGGAVAADVHGKNHHRDGSIGQHIVELKLLMADGGKRTCAPDRDSDLFWASLGGMGLTGIITQVAVKLIPIETSYVVAENFQAPNLESALAWLGDDAHDDHYTVAWIDCLSRGRNLGRSIVMRGHHARAAELPRGKPAHLAHTSNSRLTMPFDLPSFALSPLSVAMFNSLYYAVQGAKRGPFLCGYEKFFFPLDGIAHWNRMYGRRGFVQYQIAIPAAGAEAGIALVLDRLTRARMASFLTTLKRFGPGNAAPLSFPEAGYTLALDLPMSGPEVLTLLDALDESVLRFGGRVYLAKDARLAPERLRAMYPHLDTWLKIKSTHDPKGRFSSDQSRRLRLDTLH